jgi:MFS transporter, PPP family, 3-phenylpropionic acid transporter
VCRFVVLYALLYGAFGVSSPFLPRFFESRGVSPEDLGLLFGLGTGVRLLSGPLAGRVADLSGALRGMLAFCIGAATVAALALLRADGVWMLVAVGVAQAACLAPTTTLADALALGAARPREAGPARFEYGRVRGAASAAFVCGSLVAGQVLRTAPLDAVVAMHATLLAAAALAVAGVPPLERHAGAETGTRAPRGVGLLLGIPAFRRMAAVAALVLGSHAMHDTFAMVRWSAGGIGPAAGSALWSASVVAEVAVFFALGPALLARVAAGRAMALAAAAGAVRWTVMAHTTSVAALAAVQPLHGITFALLHLACMRVIASTVPPHLAATAQSIYAVGVTAATAALAVVSGRLYAAFGPAAFLAMAGLCILALPLALALRTPNDPADARAA